MKPGLVNIHHTRLHWCWVIQHRPANVLTDCGKYSAPGLVSVPVPSSHSSTPDLQWSKPQTAPASSPPAYLARSVRADRGNLQPPGRAAEGRTSLERGPRGSLDYSSLVAAVALTDNHRTSYFSLRQIPILRPCGYK